jgi:hypothetical protein
MSRSSSRSASGSRDVRGILVNVATVALALLVGYLLISLLIRHVFKPPVDASRAGEPGSAVIQVDVLNGCGIGGAASNATSYLRARGFDVVEIRNYKTFDVQESLVIDRRGDLEYARRVAYALGISKKNIVQQINDDYYVDVSVVVGRDYASLKQSQQGGTQ